MTLVLLVGAAYLYNKVIYTNPLENSLSMIASIGSFHVNNVSNSSKITAQFTSNEKLRSNFYILLDQLEGQKYNSLDQLTIEISNAEEVMLRDFLTKARLPIFEAVSTGKFSELPSYLDRILSETPIEYNLEIDNNFVFITAKTNGKFAHMVINRGQSPLNIINTMGGEYL